MNYVVKHKPVVIKGKLCKIYMFANLHLGYLVIGFNLFDYVRWLHLLAHIFLLAATCMSSYVCLIATYLHAFVIWGLDTSGNGMFRNSNFL